VSFTLTEGADSLIPFDFIREKKHGDKLTPYGFNSYVNFHASLLKSGAVKPIPYKKAS
jgi:hypothetical protein